MDTERFVRSSEIMDTERFVRSSEIIIQDDLRAVRAQSVLFLYDKTNPVII